MKSRACKYILFGLFLIAAINHKFIALAEEAITDGVIARPVIEYKSGNLRDPFKTYLTKEAPKEISQVNADLAKPELDLGKLKVQGVIWGSQTPQAIINDRVLMIGDLIEGAQIMSIDKKGITLSFNGEAYDLTSPGQKAIQVPIK
jgi:hypothetical protein